MTHAPAATRQLTAEEATEIAEHKRWFAHETARLLFERVEEAAAHHRRLLALATDAQRYADTLA